MGGRGRGWLGVVVIQCWAVGRDRGPRRRHAAWDAARGRRRRGPPVSRGPTVALGGMVARIDYRGYAPPEDDPAHGCPPPHPHTEPQRHLAVPVLHRQLRRCFLINRGWFSNTDHFFSSHSLQRKKTNNCHGETQMRFSRDNEPLGGAAFIPSLPRHTLPPNSARRRGLGARTDRERGGIRGGARSRGGWEGVMASATSEGGVRRGNRKPRGAWAAPERERSWTASRCPYRAATCSAVS